MGRQKNPVTQAIRMLRNCGADFSLFPYKYLEKGGTATAAKALKIEEHLCVKTLVMEDEQKRPFLILMHGDKTVSTRTLARVLNVKSVLACDPEVAKRHTGYVTGGISPFGTRKKLRVYAEASIMGLPEIYINAGKRGLLAKISTRDLDRILEPALVRVGL
jgi:Cys-tRNA(Pro) deacylase